MLQSVFLLWPYISQWKWCQISLLLPYAIWELSLLNARPTSACSQRHICAPSVVGSACGGLCFVCMKQADTHDTHTHTHTHTDSRRWAPNVIAMTFFSLMDKLHPEHIPNYWSHVLHLLHMLSKQTLRIMGASELMVALMTWMDSV